MIIYLQDTESMPNNITKISDYKGLNLLIDEPSGSDYFKQFCEDIESEILKGSDYYNHGLLGTEVYNDLIADLDENNEPQNAPYIDLVDGVTWTDDGGTERNFIGLRKMLVYFVYAEYLKRNHVFQSGIGTVILSPKNSTKADKSRLNREANLRWNKGVDLYNSNAFDYLLQYQSDFNNWEFTEQSKFITHGII